MILPSNAREQIRVPFTKNLTLLQPMKGIEGNHSLLHAVCNAYCITYILGRIDGVDIDKQQFVERLREQLGQRFNTNDDNTNNIDDEQNLLPEVYKLFSHVFGDKSVNGIREYLLSQNKLRIEMVPYISSQIPYDIFVINSKTGDIESSSALYFEYLNTLLNSNRSCIVLAFNPTTETFSACATLDGSNNHLSVFPPENYLIIDIKERVRSLSA